MLLLVAARLLSALFPYRMLAPEWYVNAGLELVNSSPVLIVAFLLLAWATWLDRLYTENQPNWPVAGLALRFVLKVALWVYLLVIPVQVMASVLADLNYQDRRKAEWALVQKQLAVARKQQLAQPQLDRLATIERQLVDKRNRGRRQLRLALWRDGLRVLVSAVAVVWVLRLAGRMFNG